MDEHTGTHVDAPAHFIPPQDSGFEHAGSAGALTLDKIPITQMMGPMAIIDVRDVTTERLGVSPSISRDRVDLWERANRTIKPGDVVVFRTGWDTFYKPGSDGSRYIDDVVSARTTGWPAPDGDCVRALTDRGVRCIGTDAPSMGAAHDGATAHVAGLSRGAVFVECLANLDSLPVVGAQFIFMPIRILRASGAPGRAIALIGAAG
jgi:isatin hydrolase